MANTYQWYPPNMMMPIYGGITPSFLPPPPIPQIPQIPQMPYRGPGPRRTALFLPPTPATAPYPVVLPVGLIPLRDFYIHANSRIKSRTAINGTASNVWPFDVDYRPSMWLTDTERVALSAFIFGLETLRSAIPEALEGRPIWQFEPEYDTIATVLAELFSTIARLPTGPTSAAIVPHTTSTFYAFLKPLALTSGISESVKNWYRLPTAINPKPVASGSVVTFGAPTNIPPGNEVLSDPKYGSPNYYEEDPYNLAPNVANKWYGFHELLKEIFHALWVTLDSLRKPDVDPPIPWKLGCRPNADGKVDQSNCVYRDDIQLADTPQVLQTRILSFLARLIGVHGMIPAKIREWLERLSPYQDIMNTELLMLMDAYNLRIPQEQQQKAIAATTPPPVRKELDLTLPADLRVPENQARIAVTPIIGIAPPTPTPTTPLQAAADSKSAAVAAIAAANDAKVAAARASAAALQATLESKTAAALVSSSPPPPSVGTFTAPRSTIVGAGVTGPTLTPIPSPPSAGFEGNPFPRASFLRPTLTPSSATTPQVGFEANPFPRASLRGGHNRGPLISRDSFAKRYQPQLGTTQFDDWGL